jgi:hypothetical protein
MAAKTLLATMTGEVFQPVRLHYRVFDSDGLRKAFQKLRCVEWDRTQDRWVWLYEHEAKKIRFKQSHAQIPGHLHPIVIGSFLPRTKEELLLDLRSCERAMEALPFFDKHLPRKVAKVTEAEVVNELFSTDNPQLTPADLFDRQQTPRSDPEATLRQIVERAAQVQDPQERLRIALELAQAQAREALPEVERFPVHFYEDGIAGFTLFLRVRQIVAREHWLGNADYSLSDALRAVAKSSGPG